MKFQLPAEKPFLKSAAAADEANEKVQEWEALMSNFQQVLPGTDPGDKWRWKKMEKIFSL